MEDNTLKEGEQSKINVLILTFGKTEANILKFSETLMMLIDRCVFCNKFTVVDFLELFEIAQTVKNQKPLGKDQLQGERIIGREQLIFIFNQIAKKLFKPDPNYLDKFYRLFLEEKIDVDDGEVNFSRSMSFDDLNRKILTEQFISIFKEYEVELKHIYYAYIFENHLALRKSKRLLLSHREILLQNKRWSFNSLILFLRESETTPHLTTIETVEDTMRIIVPYTNSKQQEFYNKHIILDAYQRQSEGNENTHHAGDPGVMYHEFLVLIARIAWETYPREMPKTDPNEILKRYFNYIFLRKNTDIDTVPLPNLSRKMINKMKDYYKFLEGNSGDIKAKEKVVYDPKAAMDSLIKKMNSEVMELPDLGLEYGEYLKTLEKQLPKMPALQKIEPECPPPYNKSNAVTIGMQPPPEPVDKNEKPKAQKKDAKKDEVKLRVFPWAKMPQIKRVAEDHLKSVQSKLEFEVQPLNSLSRGTIKRESYPVIIGETVFPTELPKSVVNHLKEANDAMNSQNYFLAIECYDLGLKAWKKTHVQVDSAAQLFFQYAKGAVYLSAGKLDYAFQAFFDCRRFSQTSKLQFSNPDRSLPYFGLGEVFYQMEQFQLSARSFLKARQIREAVLGLQHVQTATVFNNLACCFFMLGRSHEALGYIEIAEVVLDTELGEHHQRTMVARNNFKKLSRGTYDNQPEYRKFWEVFEQDKFQKKKKKKKADDKKKK